MGTQGCVAEQTPSSRPWSAALLMWPGWRGQLICWEKPSLSFNVFSKRKGPGSLWEGEAARCSGKLSSGRQSQLALHDFTWESRDVDPSSSEKPREYPPSRAPLCPFHAEKQTGEWMHKLHAGFRTRLVCVLNQLPVGPRGVDPLWCGLFTHCTASSMSFL